MAAKDSTPVELGPWRGLYRRGDMPPANYMHTCSDVMFRGDIVYPRPTFEEIRSIGLKPLRAYPFKLSTNPIGSRWLMLLERPAMTPQVFDVTVGGPSTLVYTLGSVLSIDMSILVAYDRAYLTFHDRIRASQFEPVIVWDPALMAAGRPMAGPKPTGTFTVASSATNGNVEAGQHIYAVANEYNTGHVTPPNLYVSLTSPGGKCVDLSVIPLGPTDVVARWILMSRVVNNPDPNLANIKLFFGFRVPDNTTTTLSGTNAINLYDSQLISDADYLKDLYETVSSGLAIGMFSNRLILGNVFVPAGTNPQLPILPPKAEHSLLLGSKPGLLESISKVDGFRQVTKSEGGGIKHVSEVNGILYARKSFMTFALQDNGAEFNKWPINQLDIANGTEFMGVSTFPGTSSGSSQGVQIVADRSGLQVFDGQAPPRALTWAVDDIWRSLDSARFAEIMVTVDPERKRLAVLLPPHKYDGVAVPAMDHMLLGDFDDGLNPESIKWSYWSRVNPDDDSTVVGFWFDYRESLIPSLTAVNQGNTGWFIHALPDDLVGGIDHTVATLEFAIPMHARGGLGHLEALRIRTAKVGTGGSMTLRVQKFPRLVGTEAVPPAVSHNIDQSAEVESFYNFINVHKQINRSGLEVAWVELSVIASLAISKMWAFIRPDAEEKLT